MVDSLPQEFLGCAEYGRFITTFADDLFDLRTHPGIGDVPAVPSHQVFYPMYCSDANMQRVDLCLLW